jgi:hypothetical protein
VAITSARRLIKENTSRVQHRRIRRQFLGMIMTVFASPASVLAFVCLAMRESTNIQVTEQTVSSKDRSPVCNESRL